MMLKDLVQLTDNDLLLYCIQRVQKNKSLMVAGGLLSRRNPAKYAQLVSTYPEYFI